MDTLNYILTLYQFTEMSEGKDPHSSYPWWKDCITQVEISLFQDRTTSKDNLREKAKNYALNYLSFQPEFSFLPKDSVANEIADEIETEFKDKHFDTRPPASVVAGLERKRIPEDPEKKFIKLR